MSETEVAAFELNILDPKRIRVFREKGTPRMTLEGDRSWTKVQVTRAFPLSNPDKYIGILDGAGKDVGLLVELTHLEAGTRDLISQELERRYFVPIIEKVLSVKEEYGSVVWKVDTDKGEIEFTIRNMRDNMVELSASRIMLTDVDGNRYEVVDIGKLDLKSQAVIMKNL